MRISKDNLVIRSVDSDDALILTNWWNDGAIMAHAGFPFGLKTTYKDTLNKINSYIDNTKALCIIEIDDTLVGEMSYCITENRATIGIKICDSRYQNKGYGTKLIIMLIDYLFYELNVNTISLDTNINNSRARHVYEKIGFKQIRIDYDSWTNQEGFLQSSVLFELNKDEYLK